MLDFLNSILLKSLRRIFDIFFSTLVLFILIIPFLIIVILIKLDSSGPPFFLQTRSGFKKKEFKIIKFRTMTHKKRINHKQVFAADPEVTRVGIVLRRTKIDELPQLINVIKGDMSIIGPRPCLPEMCNSFGKFSDYRFLVKPGLSSLAAVNGSIYLTWFQKGIYDYIYYKNKSFCLDIFIILKTFRVIFVGEKKLFSKTI